MAVTDLRVLDCDAVADRIADLWHARSGAPPIGHIELMLTEDCNHRCDYCFVRTKRPATMSFEVARGAMDFLLDQNTRPGGGRDAHILLFGGEPLLAFDLIREIVDYGKRQQRVTGFRYSYGMTTNGTLMTEEMARFLAAHDIRYLLSIDGVKEVHDAHRRHVDRLSSFDLVTQRLAMMKHYQPWQGTRMTVTPDSAGRTLDGVWELFERGINQFIVGPASCAPWTREAWEQYEEGLVRLMHVHHRMRQMGRPFRMTLYEADLKKPAGSQRNVWGCGAGRGRGCVDVEGRLYGCAKILGLLSPDRRAQHVLGNVFDGFTEPRWRAELRDGTVRRRRKCGQCDMRDDCVGGCPAVNIAATGSVFDPPQEECILTRIVYRVREATAKLAREGRE